MSHPSLPMQWVGQVWMSHPICNSCTVFLSINVYKHQQGMTAMVDASINEQNNKQNGNEIKKCIR